MLRAIRLTPPNTPIEFCTPLAAWCWLLSKPQIGGYAAASILQVVAEKPIAEIDDQTLILANLARKARQQVQNFVRELLKDEVPKRKIAPERIESLIQALTSGRVTHDYPITAEEARELGLPISTELPPQIYALMDLYPQANIGRPSVPLEDQRRIPLG